MADRIDMLAYVLPRLPVAWPAALAWLLAAGLPAAAAPAPYVARASIERVDRAFLNRGTAGLSGAGIRAFRSPETADRGLERFDIRWYANPPGIPPGTVVLLEFIQQHSPAVKSRSLRLDAKSEGHVRSVIEIPPKEIERAGRIVKWRVRIVWRGRLLAGQVSENWEG